MEHLCGLTDVRWNLSVDSLMYGGTSSVRIDWLLRILWCDVSDAAFELLRARSKLFAFNSNNAVLQFLLDVSVALFISVCHSLVTLLWHTVNMSLLTKSLHHVECDAVYWLWTTAHSQHEMKLLLSHGVCVCHCGPGGRWWQPTTGFMTMHAVTCRLTA